MRTNYWRVVGGMVLVFGMMASLAVAAEGVEGGGGRGGEGWGAIREFRQEQRKARHEHFKGQVEKNKQFHETIKDKQPNEACSDIIKNRQQRYRENTAFMNGQHKAFVAFVTKLMKENEIPAEKQAERLAKMKEHYQEMTETHQKRHEEVIAKLKELGSKEDLTWEELKSAMKEFLPRGGREGRGGDRPRRGDRGQRKQGGRPQEGLGEAEDV